MHVASLRVLYSLVLIGCASDPSATAIDDPFIDGKADDFCASGEWSLLTIDTTYDVGSSAAVVLDSNDRSHILYRDATVGALKYATNAGASWTIEKVGSSSSDSAFDSPYVALAIDRNDTLHAVYANNSTNRGVFYRTRASTDTRWSAPLKLDALTTSIARDLDLAVDSRGGVHIVYHALHDQLVRYAYRAPGALSFSRQSLDGRYGWYPSIAIDHDDGIHIAFLGNQQRPRYFHKALGTTFVEMPVATTDPSNVGEGTALQVGSDNAIHLAYWYREAPGNVRHAVRALGGIWPTPQVVGTARAGGTIAFALATNDAPTFAFEDTTYALHYVRGGADELVDEVAPARMRASLQIDHSGIAHLPLYDPANKDFIYARRCP